MNKQSVIFLNSVAFVLGFTVIFSLVGVLLQTLLAEAAYTTVNLLRIVGGTVIIFFGIFLIASLKYRIPFLMREHKIKVRRMLQCQQQRQGRSSIDPSRQQHHPQSQSKQQ